MIADGLKKQTFEARLKRISAGGLNTSSQLYAGVSEVGDKPRPAKKIKFKADVKTILPGQTSHSGASAPVSMVSGLLIGAGAVILARYIRFLVADGALAGPDADIIMAIDIVLAVTIAIVLRSVFRFKSGTHRFAKLLGIGAMVLLMQNLVHVAPGLFERAFSVAWVDQVITTTTPKSLLLAGASYELSSVSAQISGVFAGGQ